MAVAWTRDGSPRREITDKENAKLLKAFGLKALQGSKKQKLWANSLRVGLLKTTESELVLDFMVNSTAAQHSRFWIDTRKFSRVDLNEIIHSLIEATQSANAIGYANPGYYEQLAKRKKAEDRLGVEL